MTANSPQKTLDNNRDLINESAWWSLVMADDAQWRLMFDTGGLMFDIDGE